ncbi:hypothetical protein [Pantoea cypripedii]|uniref:Uncharacterized protein n=1 Tax=Pantoea cypripedii TaxID=55209 RepID=A0A6B9FVW2_PANCY|nr:hypothetical protein [Pantoea cypripedii]QGY27418.1 hypothetical protein CUN67_00015 [Pantoea cypripedii]
MNNVLKEEVLKNRDDLIEGTFCYSLFEDSLFECSLLEELIDNCILLTKENGSDSELKDFLSWMVNCIDQCFSSHKDESDLYTIRNYSPELERQWTNVWRPKISEMNN